LLSFRPVGGLCERKVQQPENQPHLLSATENPGRSTMHRAKRARAPINLTPARTIAQEDQRTPAAQAGSPEAFAEIHANYSQRLYKTILGITKNPEDAEDALQETFLRAHLALHTFEGRSNIYCWLTRIAINSALMILRRRRSHPEILFNPQPDPQADVFCLEVKDSAPDPEQIYDLRQRQVKMLREIRRLRPKLRAPIQMQIVQSSSLKEISQALNLSEATVKARLHRARLRLLKLTEFKPFREQPG
jgi:RNA polymerase sigma-70 factor, ECF subfamily